MIKPTRSSKLSGANTKIHASFQTKLRTFINENYPHCYDKHIYENHEKEVPTWCILKSQFTIKSHTRHLSKTFGNPKPLEITALEMRRSK